MHNAPLHSETKIELLGSLGPSNPATYEYHIHFYQISTNLSLFELLWSKVNFFFKNVGNTVVKMDFLLSYIIWSGKIWQTLKLPECLLVLGHLEYVCWSLGEFGDKYEISLFLFSKITFFFFDRHFSEFRRKGCEKIWKCKQSKSKQQNSLKKFVIFSKDYLDVQKR